MFILARLYLYMFLLNYTLFINRTYALLIRFDLDFELNNASVDVKRCGLFPICFDHIPFSGFNRILLQPTR
jgi:hypothetical protein